MLVGSEGPNSVRVCHQGCTRWTRGAVAGNDAVESEQVWFRLHCVSRTSSKCSLGVMPQAMDVTWGELGDGQSQFLPVDTVALALSDNEVIQLGSRERRATTREAPPAPPSGSSSCSCPFLPRHRTFSRSRPTNSSLRFRDRSLTLLCQPPHCTSLKCFILSSCQFA